MLPVSDREGELMRGCVWKVLGKCGLPGLLVLLLPSCVTLGIDLDSSQKRYRTDGASRERFVHCAGHGCAVRRVVALDNTEWRRIEGAFGTPGPGEDAAGERERIRHVLAEMEKVVGAKTGTSTDVGGSFAGVGKPGQMDCVDEMLNVATYLTLLIDEGLITQHRLGRRYTNHIFKTGGWPHTATSIVEKKSGQEFVVDSWWLKNGSLPYIVTRAQWSEGEWDRPKSAADKRRVEASMP
jgi:hypothetical protein